MRPVLCAALLLACTPEPTNGCPKGSTLHAPEPERAQWCRKPNGKGGHVNHGPFTSWYPNGQMEATGTYLDGSGHGPFTQWHINGNRMMQGEMVHGKKHGPWLNWHLNGNVAIQSTFVNGDEQGYWRSYWEEGSLSAEGNFKDGWEHGHWKFWQTNGHPDREGNYVDGKRHGWWRRWQDDGKLKGYYQWRKGEEVNYRLPGDLPPPWQSSDPRVGPTPTSLR